MIRFFFMWLGLKKSGGKQTASKKPPMPIYECGDTSSTCNRFLKCLQVPNFFQHQIQAMRSTWTPKQCGNPIHQNLTSSLVVSAIVSDNLNNIVLFNVLNPVLLLILVGLAWCPDKLPVLSRFPMASPCKIRVQKLFFLRTMFHDWIIFP